MRVAIVLTQRAYLPEAFAYRDYLVARGHAAACVDDVRAAADADVAIVFTLAHQRALAGARARVVHEYHSLSTGRWRGVKHAAKRWLAPRPAARIFLSREVEARYGFDDALPAIIRPMGVDAALFDCARGSRADVDIVYCGTLERPGVLPAIAQLGAMGLTLLVVGAVPDGVPTEALPGVEFAGPLPRGAIPAALARARFGLNVTPDVDPYDRQTSTKTIEYAAAGLGIISNRYRWIEEFVAARGIEPVWLDALRSPAMLATAAPARADMRDLLWERVLDASGFERLLAGTLGR